MPRAAKTIVHVNQHVIRRNTKTGERNPVLTVKRGKANAYAHEVVLRDAAGAVVARLVYRPDRPLSCGARVWLEVPPGVAVECVTVPGGSDGPPPGGCDAAG